MAAKASDEGTAAEDRMGSLGERSKEDELAGDGDGNRRSESKRKSNGEDVEKETAKKERKRRSVSKDGVSPLERPSRERKTIERLSDMTPRNVPVSKILSIEQGPGTKLKDIPNVSFKLSKRKIDENLQVLHTILFGKKSKAHYLKRNVAQFSGFHWIGNEEKQKTRVREKLEKCKKDKLVDFCELLDIQIVRAATKKEEITERLLEFLQSPHATRDVVLAEKEKKKKRKRTSKIAADGASLENEMQEHKTSMEHEVKKGRRPTAKTNKKNEDEESNGLDEKDGGEHGSAQKDVKEGVSSGNEDTSGAEKDNSDTEQVSENVKSGDEEDEDEPDEPLESKEGSIEKHKVAEPKVKEKVSSVKNKGPGRPVKNISTDSKASRTEKAATANKGSQRTPKNATKSLSSNKTAVENGSVPSASLKTKTDNEKNQGSGNPVTKDKTSQRQPTKSKSKVSAKEQAAKGKAGPSTEELHAVVSDILEVVDFTTATLADILKKLGSHFKKDMMDRKVEVKHIIEDIIENLPEAEDDEGDDDLEDVDGDRDSRD